MERAWGKNKMVEMKKYPLTKKDKELINIADDVRKNAEKKLKMKSTAQVGSSLITSDGNIYSGINVGFYCGIGSCAEAQAIGAMLTNGEREIDTIVAISESGIYPPCGKCREMIFQTNKKNLNTFVIISKSKKVKLKELLPLLWQEVDGSYL